MKKIVLIIGLVVALSFLLMGCGEKNITGEAAKAASDRVKVECSDRLDNDGDGAVDLADAGCVDKKDKDETNCGDGVCEGGETQQNCAADCGTPGFCADSDGGDYPLVAGTVNQSNESGSSIVDDNCISPLSLTEWGCNGVNLQAWLHQCREEYGADFACVEDSNERGYCANVGNASNCTDSDGGDMPLVPGFVTWAGAQFNDLCGAEGLLERICLNNVAEYANHECASEFGEGSDCLVDGNGYAYCSEGNQRNTSENTAPVVTDLTQFQNGPYYYSFVADASDGDVGDEVERVEFWNRGTNEYYTDYSGPDFRYYYNSENSTNSSLPLAARAYDGDLWSGWYYETFYVNVSNTTNSS